MGTSLGGAVDIVQTTSYYPFGLVMNQSNGNTSSSYGKNEYLYNGKEHQDDVFGASSLNWYDYGARFYDPQIGRWSVIDGKAEKYYSWSPYVYAINDPIKFIDVDGNDIYIWYPTGFHDGNYTMKSFKFNGSNGADAPKNEYVRNVIRAYVYNIENGGGDNLKEAATNPDLNISVSYGYAKEDVYANGYVYWDPYAALATENGLFLSPATLLEHEFDHAVDDAKYPKAHADRKEQGNEEERVINGSEKKTATKNKEIKPGQVRNNHEGIYYDVNDPIRNRFVFGEKRDDDKDLQNTLNYFLQRNPNIRFTIYY